MTFVSDRFQIKVRIGGPDDCWEWQAARKPDGYGNYYVEKGCFKGAHIVAFEWFHGRPVALGMEIMHTCDNPPCVNPAHLKEGTHLENMLDSYNKGRLPVPPQTPEAQARQRANTPRGDRHHMKRKESRQARSGEANHNRKLNWEKVNEIRRLRVEEKMTTVALGKQFGVSNVLIGMICRGEIWAEDGYERRQAKKQKSTEFGNKEPIKPAHSAKPLAIQLFHHHDRLRAGDPHNGD